MIVFLPIYLNSENIVLYRINMSEIIYNENFVSNSKFNSTRWSWRNIYGLVNVCLTLRLNRCVCVCMYSCMYAYLCMHVCVFLHVSVCVCVFACVYIHVCLHVCVCVTGVLIRLKGKCSNIHQYGSV